MSHIVTTPLGRFQRVNTGSIDGNPNTWLFECPGCGGWAYLDENQWAGTVSVDHTSTGCRYHETHEYGKQLVTTIQSRILMGENPADPEEADSVNPQQSGEGK